MSEIPDFLEPQEPAFVNIPSGGEPKPWYQIWIDAITKPNEENFRKLAALPNAKASRAYLWVFLSYVVVIALIGIMQLTFGLSSMTSQFSSYGMDSVPIEDMGISLIGFLCASPFLGGIAVLGFILGTALIQWMAKLFGGTGTFDKLAFVFGAIDAPMALISGVVSALSFIPIVGILFSLASFGLSIYAFVLHVFAVKAVDDLDTGKAVGAILLPGLLFFLLICCCVFIIFALAGASAGDLFNGVSQGLY